MMDHEREDANLAVKGNEHEMDPGNEEDEGGRGGCGERGPPCGGEEKRGGIPTLAAVSGEEKMGGL